jgi:hypothetical protein
VHAVQLAISRLYWSTSAGSHPAVGKCFTRCSTPCWMKKIPVDSSGSTKALDSPIATQLFTQDRRLRPTRMRMWFASRPSAPGPTKLRSVRSASSGPQKSLA